MDTFIDKLAQKRNAQGMINANAAADAAKIERLQNRMAEYDMMLQEMRKINLRTAENVEQARKVLWEGYEKIRTVQENSNTQADKEELLAAAQKQTDELLAEMRKQTEEFLAETKRQSGELLSEFKMQSEALFAGSTGQSEMFLTETKRQSETFLQENKKQSEALLQESKKQTEALLQESKKQSETLLTETRAQKKELLAEAGKRSEELLAEADRRSGELLTEIKKQIEDSFRQSDDFLHKENVKVYRNVQAAVTEELSKQMDALAAKQKENAGKQKAMLPISIVIMLLVIADIIINLFNIVLY